MGEVKLGESVKGENYDLKVVCRLMLWKKLSLVEKWVKGDWRRANLWFYAEWGRCLSHDPHLSVYKKRQLVRACVINKGCNV